MRVCANNLAISTESASEAVRHGMGLRDGLARTRSPAVTAIAFRRRISVTRVHLGVRIAALDRVEPARSTV
jgi:hypothetical protein